MVKSVLLYNSQTWRLLMNDKHNLSSFHCEPLRTAIHIKFPHVISNSKLYQQTTKLSLTLTMLKNRWKFFSLIIFVFIHKHQLNS